MRSVAAAARLPVGRVPAGWSSQTRVRRRPARPARPVASGFRPRMRLVSLLVAMGAALSLVAARLVWVQGVDSAHFVALASVQRDRTVTLPAQRGSILDRNGRVLAMSVDAKTLIADPRLIVSAQATAQTLAPILGMNPADLATKLSNGTGFAYLARRIDPAVAKKVLGLGIPGIQAISEPLRVYPDGQLAAHVLGFVGTDAKGLSGLESTYDAGLVGHPGQIEMQADPQGQAIVSAQSDVTPPRPGSDVVLTLDQDVQFEAETVLAQAVQAYSAKGGTIVVMRPGTGEVLALANYPSFDPNNFSAAPQEALADRAVSDVYEPGSASKVITAAAALETGAVTTHDVINVPDSLKVADATFHDAEYHPTLNLTLPQILEQSSNVGTIKIAATVGKQNLYSYLQKFGYGAKTSVGLPGESTGILPNVSSWSATTLPTAAIGQGVAVTVMQMMSIYATVANGGVLAPPHVVAGVRDANGSLKPTTLAAPRRVIKASTAATLTQMLMQVVNGATGTAPAAAIPGYQVAGKTGTAEKPAPGGGYAGYTASFIGFAPAADPQLAVGVVLDQPTPIWGGSTAAPTFRTVMQFALQRLGIGPGPVLPVSTDGAGTPLPAPARSGGAATYPALNPSAAPVAPGVAE